MCGIGVIGSGIHICPLDSSPPPSSRVAFSIDDLKSALSRRGPDSLGTKTLHLHPEASTPLLPYSDNKNAEFPNSPVVAELHFIGATLQLRGPNPVAQPFADSSGNILVYNGEIFGGIDVDSDCNDGEALMQALEGNSVPEVLSMIKGPWAVIYWQESLRTLWFGRDAFGRRSILVHWPSLQDSRFLLSSVSPFPSLDQSSGFEAANGRNLNFWEELTCGIYSLSMDANKLNGCVVGEVRKHEWANKNLVELIKWERACVKPTLEELHSCGCKTLVRQNDLYLVPLEAGPDGTSVSSPAQHVLAALRKSVMVRTSSYKNFQEVRFGNQQEDFVPVAVLFSGGLDSMILAALLDECSDPCYGIDLLNVSFDGESAPDRISAKAGLQELKRIAPLRRWKLVEINADLCNLTLELSHITTLINPARTYMDLNIGIALWLAASGDGWVSEATSNSRDENNQQIKYKSEARIVLVGAGADEQCAGYGRHRTKYRNGSWDGLHEEMKLDMQRIWKRNMGRDDRCIADNGKEARFPFLDEDVIRTLLDIPLWKVANLDQPTGIGDKKILREVAGLLGLHEAAVLPKRAIQFGSRVARESNRKNFGSNRAANLASAGSANINNIKVQSSSFSVMSDWKRERTALHNAKSG